jgi:hypothetical protein
MKLGMHTYFMSLSPGLLLAKMYAYLMRMLIGLFIYLGGAGEKLHVLMAPIRGFLLWLALQYTL